MRFEPISVSLLPNYEPDDFRFIKRLLVKPEDWRIGPTSKKLESWFEGYFPGFKAVSFLSGRVALKAVLKSLGVGKGDEVVVPAFSCVVVPVAVKSLGAKPVYADINEDSNNLTLSSIKKVVTKRTKSVVVQHTFGFPAEVEKIVAWCHQRQILVVEDCAHGIGIKVGDQWLGSFGDGAIFSFGRDKAVSSVFGGLGLVKNKWGRNLVSCQQKMNLPTNFFIFKQLFYPLYFRASLDVYNFFNLGKLMIWLGQWAGLLSMAVFAGEKKGQTARILEKRMPEALAQIAFYQLSKIDRFNQARVDAVEFYGSALKSLPIRLPLFKAGNQTLPLLRFTIKVPDPQLLYEFSKKRNVVLNNWYYPCLAPSGVVNEKVAFDPIQTPRAQTSSLQVVNLPTHPRLRRADLEKVVRVIKDFYA